MAHLHYETDYTVSNLVKQLVCEHADYRNQIVDLRRELQQAFADLEYCNRQRGILEQQIARIDL